MSYDGAKFRPAGDEVYYTEWGDKATRTRFVPTRGYIEYCQMQQLRQEKQELLTMKNKLRYQQKHYGEIDPIDLREYNRRVAILRQAYVSCYK